MLKTLRVDRTGRTRTPQEVAAERQRQIDNSVVLSTPKFPGPARPASGLVSGRKLRS